MVLQQLQRELSKPEIRPEMITNMQFDAVEMEEFEYEEEEYEEEIICRYHEIAEDPESWSNKALQKFDNQLKITARQSSGSFSPKFAMKIRHRYETLIKLRHSKISIFFIKLIYKIFV